MTIETYPEMNAKIVGILRWDKDNPALLYAAQRIEELERTAGIRGECLAIAMETLRQYALGRNNAASRRARAEILGRLAELEEETE